VALDAETMAKELGSGRAANMVMLGAASPFVDLDVEKLKAGIQFIFGRKGEKIVDMNIKALEAGREVAEANK
jgi:indolepyruvate ferredoxin oxidoreductase beta subunit